MIATIYHNPRCAKSRQALALLAAAGVETVVVRYLDEPPTVAALDALLRALDLAPEAIIRTGEPLYAELGLAKRTPTRAAWLALLHAHPILIERPIVTVGDKALVARPPERVHELIGP